MYMYMSVCKKFLLILATYIHAYIHTYTLAYKLTYMHTYMHTYIHAHIRTSSPQRKLLNLKLFFPTPRGSGKWPSPGTDPGGDGGDASRVRRRIRCAPLCKTFRIEDLAL